MVQHLGLMLAGRPYHSEAWRGKEKESFHKEEHHKERAAWQEPWSSKEAGRHPTASWRERASIKNAQSTPLLPSSSPAGASHWPNPPLGREQRSRLWIQSICISWRTVDCGPEEQKEQIQSSTASWCFYEYWVFSLLCVVVKTLRKNWNNGWNCSGAASWKFRKW